MKLLRPKYGSVADEELMVLLSKGDKRAFDELYNRYAGPLTGYFMRMLWRDREKAEDLLHDIFAKLIRRPELFDVQRCFKTWVYSVAHNMCKNEYKRHEVRKNTVNGLEKTFHVGDPQSNVLQEVHEQRFKLDFNRSLEELDVKHREVFRLRHIDGLSIKEIADIMGINDGTVKSRLFYATKYLAQSLEQYNPLETSGVNT